MKTFLKHKLLIGGAIGCLMLIVLLIALGHSKDEVAPTPEGPPEVAVVAVEQKDVLVYGEWIGSLDSLVMAEIKAHVSGSLLRKDYTEGSFVRKGQLLFEIDPRPFQAALDLAKGELAKAEGQVLQAEGQLAQADSQLLQSEAQLAQAEDNQVKAQLDVNRYAPLAREKTVTDQELDNAVLANTAAKANVMASSAKVERAKAEIAVAKANVEAAKATVLWARASVQTAQLDLSFTQITALIDGIAGIAQAQVGDLVGPHSSTLTTVSTVDPIKAYFTPSEQEYLNYTRRNPTPSHQEATSKETELELILADGSVYPQKGRIYLADRQVDQKTGTIRVAGLFPNPGNILRPGQYAKVRAVTSTKKGALLIPQRAVSELHRNYSVTVVGADNKLSVRPVKVGERVGALWVIEEGLQPGERVVAEGTQKVRPDAVVRPKPFATPSATAQ